ncbi:hypothetical protein ACIQCJ_22965 [Streptomyces sp. NPDC093221]|uniref:hypothetical protein n=1 Tax=unclassified Streptomyces TaxID=2593676 RepID=UPI00380F6793
MSKSERMAKSAAVGTLMVLAATGCGGAMNNGNVSPDSVEKKAHTLTQQALDALTPVIGSADTSVEHQGWKQCSTETPGNHRFEYTYILKLDVLVQDPEAALAAAKAHFAKEGYLPGPPQTDRVSASEAHSTWGVAVGVDDDKKSMFISVDSDCVFTTHDPPKTGSSS